MYAQVIDDLVIQIVDEQSLREMYPSTHFPAVITQVALDGFENWYVIEDEASMPEYDKSSKKVEFVRAFNGTKVVGTYNVVDLSNAEKLAAKEARKRHQSAFGRPKTLLCDIEYNKGKYQARL